MKNILHISKKFLAIIFFMLLACDEDSVKPTLPEATLFVAPVFTSPATSTSVEFLPENESSVYETFNWEIAEYGVKVSVRYELEISDDEDFTNTASLLVVEGDGTSSLKEVPVTVKAMNDKMLALGLPGFQESTVYVRVKSTINGTQSTPLFSNLIERTATTYQSSDCGAYCTVGLIGNGTTGDESGWNNDIDMRLQDATGVDKSTWTLTAYLHGGFNVKFRAQDSWDTNWGSAAFPTGTGTQGGADIPITTSGYYKITLNDQTGEYSFVEAGSTEFPTIGVVGSATTGDESGWNSDIDLTQDGSDPHVWSGTITLFTGAAKFRANNGWDNNWGNSVFPSGFGIGGGPDIPITVAGTYFIWFNDATGEYFFGPAANASPFATIGLIGSTLTGDGTGWEGSDVDMIQNPANPYKWSKIHSLFEGAGKFRADNAWDVNWGGSGFPSGIGTQGGNDIPVQEGSYFITFNSLTGEYKFLK